MLPNTAIITKSTNFVDVQESIQKMESRAMKMLTLIVAIASVSLFTDDYLPFLIAFPFFMLSFFSYLLTYIRSPNGLIREFSREELYIMVKNKLISDEAIHNIYQNEKIIREKFFKNRDRKIKYIYMGHISFVVFTLTFFILSIVNKIDSTFLNATNITLLLLVESLVFVLLHQNLSESENLVTKLIS